MWLAHLPPAAAHRLVALLSEPSGDRAGRRARRWSRDWIGRRGRVEVARRAAVLELCDGIVVELTAGRPTDVALVGAAQVTDDRLRPALAPVLAAARTGGDVAAALEEAAAVPGAGALRLLAGCWRIGVERGGALSSVVDGLATTLRDEEAYRVEVAAQSAGPKATARLLAGLPLLGLAMAAALGADPLGFLFGSLPGAACLVLGVALDILGLWWTRRIVAR